MLYCYALSCSRTDAVVHFCHASHVITWSCRVITTYHALLLDLANDVLLLLALRLGTVYRRSWDVLLWTLPLGVVWRWSCSLELMGFLLTFSSGVSRRGLEGVVRPFGRHLGWRRCTASRLSAIEREPAMAKLVVTTFGKTFSINDLKGSFLHIF